MVNRNRLLETFMEYVRIDSESGDEREMCLKVEQDLKALGADVIRQGNAQDTHSNGWNLLCTLKGSDGLPPLILSAHLDTVSPGKGIEPVLGQDGVLRSKGPTILGGDDKCGVAAMVELARSLKDHPVPHRTVQLIFTVGEESGQYGAKALEKDRSLLETGNALVLDSSGPPGRMVISAPGHTVIRAVITGKASHAGNRPLEGISAITTAARAVAAMKLGKVDEETTANIGTLSAVGATNVVNPRTEFIAEARSRNKEKLKAQTDHMTDCLKAACHESGAALDYEIEHLYEGFDIPEDHPFLLELSGIFRSMGISPFTASSGGGSDANALNAMGIMAVNLGVGMTRGHSTEEELAETDLYDTARFLWEAAIYHGHDSCRG
ncbi:M20/M25/M40 family metallo-hydrolase [Clostridiales bacterium TF09-2AC]|nr:M20/M25/M40 family metallo-hydrolase [Clostridiales bacterium TF09-2AC]